MRTVTFAGTPMELAGQAIEVGQKAPNFTAVKQDLSELSLADTVGKVRVISVVPSIDTPVCATQTRFFNKEATSLGDVEILTVSMDLPFAQGRFCAAEGIEHVEVLSDYKTAEFGEKYGFLMKPLRLLARGIVVLDREGVVRYVEYVPEVTNDVNFDAALEAVKALV